METEKSGLFCYREMARPCDASCMAYETVVPAGPDFIGKQWAHCMLLVNEHRKGKHLVVLASSADKLVRYEDDKRRLHQPLPPTVR